MGADHIHPTADGSIALATAIGNAIFNDADMLVGIAQWFTMTPTNGTFNGSTDPVQVGLANTIADNMFVDFVGLNWSPTNFTINNTWQKIGTFWNTILLQQ